jgi:hypothetical protein
VRRSPLPASALPAGNAVANSAIVSNPSSVTELVEISLTMPSQFVVSGSPVDGTGGFTVSWAPEAPGLVFGTPATFNASIDTVTDASDHATAPAISFSSNAANEWALLVGTFDGEVLAPTGAWNLVEGVTSGAGQYAFYIFSQLLDAAGTFSTGSTWVTTASTWLLEADVFGTTGGTPTIIQAGTPNVLGTTSFNITHPVTPGNSLYFVVQGTLLGAIGSVALTDNVGDSFELIGQNSHSGGSGSGQFQATYLVTNAVGGSTTVTATFNTTWLNGRVCYVEMSGIGDVLLYPSFIPVAASGTVWYTGSGAPVTLHNNGDFYLDSSSGNYYEQVAGVWTLEGNLTGPTGATGATGATGPAGPTGGLTSRTTASHTTATLAGGATESSSFAIAKSFYAMQVQVSSAARVRLYSTAAFAATDLSRAFTTSLLSPTYVGTENGCILDLNLNSSTGLTWVMSPSVQGSNADSSPSSTIYYNITNTGIGGAITVTVTYLPFEV